MVATDLQTGLDHFNALFAIQSEVILNVLLEYLNV